MYTDPSGYRRRPMSFSEAMYEANWISLGNDQPGLDFADIYPDMAMDGIRGYIGFGHGLPTSWRIRGQWCRMAGDRKKYLRIGNQLYGYRWEESTVWVPNDESTLEGLEMMCIRRKVFYPIAPEGSTAGGGDIPGGRDWVDNTQIGVESFGLANSSKQQLIKLAAKSDASINNLKYVKGVKVVGKVAVVGSVALTGYQTYSDIQNGNYYSAATRAAVLGVGLAATAIPVAGWFVAGGIGLADAIWGDQFYNWVELNLSK